MKRVRRNLKHINANAPLPHYLVTQKLITFLISKFFKSQNQITRSNFLPQILTLYCILIIAIHMTLSFLVLVAKKTNAFPKVALTVSYRPWVGNLRPAGHIRPADTFYPARDLFLKLRIYPARNFFT